MADPSASPDLHGRTVVITRPPDSAGALARRVHACGGTAVRLPGLALRAVADEAAAREALRSALSGDRVLVFSSPAAVRHAARLAPLRTRAAVLAVGQGTARALRRLGLEPQVPDRQDSEGLLALPALADCRGTPVALIGAAGGRGLLPARLRRDGAGVRQVHVYQRGLPRLDRRHWSALQALPADACVLLSSAQALSNLRQLLPQPLWQRLCRAAAVVSSERLADAARGAGFGVVRRAASALPGDLLAAAAEA